MNIINKYLRGTIVNDIYIFFFFNVLGIEPWALHMLGKHSSTLAMPQSYILAFKESSHTFFFQNSYKNSLTLRKTDATISILQGRKEARRSFAGSVLCCLVAYSLQRW
jgi:hypothetical protein